MTTFTRDYGSDVQALYGRVLALGDIWKGGFARHHVVPVDVANESRFISEIYGIELYQQRFNTLDNVIILPVTDADAAGLGMLQHKGNHPEYRAAILRVHAELRTEYLARLALDPSASVGWAKPTSF